MLKVGYPHYNSVGHWCLEKKKKKFSLVGGDVTVNRANIVRFLLLFFFSFLRPFNENATLVGHERKN